MQSFFFRTRALMIGACLLVQLAMTDMACAEDALPPNMAWVFSDNVVHGGTVTPSLDAFSLSFGAMPVPVFTNAFVSQGYAEAYLGPAVPVGPLLIGAGVGLETANPAIRGAFTVAHASDIGWGIGMLEYGGSGPYARLLGAYTPTTWFGVGANLDAQFGAGPYAEVRPFGAWLPVTINSSLLVGKDPEKPVYVFGGYFSL